MKLPFYTSRDLRLLVSNPVELYRFSFMSSMAATKLLIVVLSTVLFALCFGGSGVGAEENVQILRETPSDPTQSSAIQTELEQLESNLHILERRLAESDEIMKSKDETVANLDKVVQDKSNRISLLQSEIHSMQKKGTSEEDERVADAYAQATELQNQFNQLKKELEIQSKEKNDLKAQASEAEKKIKELNSELNNIQKVSDAQQAKMKKMELALQEVQEEMMKAKLEASTTAKKLLEVHNSWLPPWLSKHAKCFQAFVVTKWNEHGDPAMKILIQKGMQINSQLEKWASPHIETIRIKWAPLIKEKWLMVVDCLGPHLKLASGKTVEAYKAFRTSTKPHVVKVQELIDPHYQKVKKFGKPYVDQVATKAKPHVEKARVALEPYTKNVVLNCRKFLETATTYHHQVQATVRKTMKNHEIARHLATNELVWFMASALLALPFIFVSKIFSAMLS